MINLALDIGTTAGPESVLFYFLAPISILASIGMLLVKKAVHSALLLAWLSQTHQIWALIHQPFNCSALEFGIFGTGKSGSVLFVIFDAISVLTFALSISEVIPMYINVTEKIKATNKKVEL